MNFTDFMNFHLPVKAKAKKTLKKTYLAFSARLPTWDFRGTGYPTTKG